MRGSVCLTALVMLLGAGCSDDDIKKDTGPGLDAEADTGLDGGADGFVGDLGVTTPGCTPACSADEVCNGGTCEKPGPTKQCGSDPYGTVPAGAVIYVDKSHGGPYLGTKQNPYNTIAAALSAGGPPAPSDAGAADAGAADAGAPDAGSTAVPVIAVATGIYKEQLTLKSSVELHCRCAEKVRIAGTIQIAPTSSAQVTIDGCEIAPEKQAAKPTDWGTCYTSSEKPCKQPSDCASPETCDPKTLECVHPQAGLDRGIWVKTGSYHGVDLLVRDSVITGWCSGIRFNADTQSSSSICVARTRVWGNHIGLDLENAPPAAAATLPAECGGAATTEAVAASLNRIEQNEYAGVFSWSKARGVALRANRVAETGRLTTPTGVKKSTAAGGFGVYLGNTSSANLDANVIADNENVGLGMINTEAFKETNLELRRNVVSGNAGAGISLQQLQASKPVKIIDNVVGQTGDLAGWKGGDGVQVIVSHGTSFAVTVKGNRIQASKRHGVLLDGVSGSVDSNQVTHNGGYGLYLQQAPKVTVGTNTFGNNGQGKLQNVATAVELCGVLPLPLP
jgi:hypothetical protein